MYASLSLELFMHLLLVVFTWQRHFWRRKRNNKVSNVTACEIASQLGHHLLSIWKTAANLMTNTVQQVIFIVQIQW